MSRVDVAPPSAAPRSHSTSRPAAETDKIATNYARALAGRPYTLLIGLDPGSRHAGLVFSAWLHDTEAPAVPSLVFAALLSVEQDYELVAQAAAFAEPPLRALAAAPPGDIVLVQESQVVSVPRSPARGARNYAAQIAVANTRRATFAVTGILQAIAAAGLEPPHNMVQVRLPRATKTQRMVACNEYSPTAANRIAALDIPPADRIHVVEAFLMTVHYFSQRIAEAEKAARAAARAVRAIARPAGRRGLGRGAPARAPARLSDRSVRLPPPSAPEAVDSASEEEEEPAPVAEVHAPSVPVPSVSQGMVEEPAVAAETVCVVQDGHREIATDALPVHASEAAATVN